MDEAGFADTQIVIPDGGVATGDPLMEALASNSTFAAAVAGIGAHYPCNGASILATRV